MALSSASRATKVSGASADAVQRLAYSLSQRIAATALALVVGLVGCSASPATGTVASGRRLLSDGAPSVQPLGYRARLVVSVDSSREGDNWTDVAVLDATERGLELCSALVRREIATLEVSHLAARLVRDCSLAALPPMEMPREAYLLVARRTVPQIEALLLLDHAPGGGAVDAQIVITDFSLLSSEEECQRMAAELEARARADRIERAESGESFLLAQASEAREEAERACAEEAELEARCSAIDDAVEREACELDRERARRSCSVARNLEERLRQRLEPAEANQTTSLLQLECCRAPDRCRSFGTDR